MPVSINAVELTNPNIACKGGLALLHKIQKRQKKLTYIIVIQQGIPLLGKIFIRVDGHENIRLCNGGTLLKPPFRFQSKMETSNKKKRKDTSDQDFFAKLSGYHARANLFQKSFLPTLWTIFRGLQRDSALVWALCSWASSWLRRCRGQTPVSLSQSRVRCRHLRTPDLLIERRSRLPHHPGGENV